MTSHSKSWPLKLALVGMIACMHVLACGTAKTLPNLEAAPPLEVPGPKTESIDRLSVRWGGNFPTTQKPCRREYHADYDVATGQGNYIHGCAAFDGNGYLDLYEARAISLDLDQQQAMQNALAAVPLTTLAQVYPADGRYADVVTFGVDLQTAQSIRHVSLHASKTIGSPPLIRLFELLAAYDFLGPYSLSED